MSVSERFSSDRWVYVSIALLALLAWGTILFAPNALFWDDWVLANDDTIRMTRELGLPWVGYIDVALFALGPWTFKVVVIASTIVTGCLTYAISGRGLGLGRGERWMLAALVVVLPLMAARVVVSLSLYSWSLALFMVAWYLMVRRSPQDSGRLRYIFAALLLFASYTTGSLLPFTILPVAHLALLGLKRDGSIVRNCIAFVWRFWYIFAAPVVFWVFRTLFLQPTGLYDKYNSVGELTAVPSYIKIILVALVIGFAFVAAVLLYHAIGRVPRRRWVRDLLVTLALAASTGVLGIYLYFTRVTLSPVVGRIVPVTILICAIVFAIYALLEARRARRAESQARSTVPVLLAVGLLVLVLAMLPYLVVGKLPTFADWETRHQLLMPFGVALIIVAAVRAISLLGRPLWARAFAGVVVVAMLGTSMFVSLTLVADWHRQMQVSAALAESDIVRDSSMVVYVDTVRGLSYDNRGYAFYEFNGWLITAFGDQKRLGVEVGSLEDVLGGSLDGLQYAASRYGFGDYTPSDSNAFVKIVPVEGASWWGLLFDRPTITVEVTAVEDVRTLIP
ncbi:hypothetical protein BH10ACT7_BH10ACT7_11410 [soil metagenome]